jgi:hypothetical protein
MHIQLRSAEGGTYQLADMYRRGPNPLADMDRGVHIRGESKSAVTPAPNDYKLSQPSHLKPWPRVDEHPSY